jgi:4-amino-4-deoxy-L-arabinose transferase-like glycosyltransferase
MTKSKFFLTTVLLLSLLTRTIGLSSRPFGFTWDEAALGYNSYSLLKTGKDEHGQITPIVFKSFGDYKPGLYIYLTVPTTALMGLQEFSTRLPSAILGSLLVILIYVLCRLLFPDQKLVASVAAVVSTFNPWLIHFSRGAWEANLSLFLSVLGVVLFLWYDRKKTVWPIFLSSISFGLTFWAYQGAKMFTPLLVLILGLIYLRRFDLRRVVLPVLLGFFFLLPVLLGASTQSGRLKVFSVFSYVRDNKHIEEIIKEDNQSGKNWMYYLFHSETLDQLRGVSQRYLNHFSPRFVFTDGDWTNLRHSEYKHGYFYLMEVVGLVLGFILLLRSHFSKSVRLVILWMLLSPLPAALSRDLVSGVRSLPLVIPLIIMVSIGAAALIRHKVFRYLYILPWLFFIAYFLEFYIFHAKFYAADQWVSPYKEAVEVISDQKANYSRVYFTNQLGQPYIFILYYLRYDPVLFQKEVVSKDDASGDVGEVSKFGNFNFEPIFWPSLRGQSDALFIGGQYELPEKDLSFPGVRRVADIYYPNGSHALRIVGID